MPMGIDEPRRHDVTVDVEDRGHVGHIHVGQVADGQDAVAKDADIGTNRRAIRSRR